MRPTLSLNGRKHLYLPKLATDEPPKRAVLSSRRPEGSCVIPEPPRPRPS
jgi:hypothetical protein